MNTLNTRIADNIIRGLMIAALFIVLLTVSLVSEAQTVNEFIGLETAFGTRSFSIKSNIPQIDGMDVMQEGGNLGFVYGNSVIRTHVTLLGFYYSASCVKRTIDQFTSGASFSVHPLRLIAGRSTAFSPYLVSGAFYNNVRFFGRYLDNNPDQKINYSTTREPYMGSVKGVTASLGAGLEYNKIIENGFIQVFGEANYGMPVANHANKAAFENTTVSETVSVQLGVRFGIIR